MSTPNRRRYENPLVDRYASAEMSFVWSPQKKFTTWRRLWVALAQAERELGLPISEAQLAALTAKVDDINFERAEALERKLRHDVMSHIHAFAEQCPEARPILHLGATSCDITDNTELIQTREALDLVGHKLSVVLAALRDFAMAQRDLPTLGYTHYQPAQLTTVGKRATLWLHDFLLDARALARLRDELPFRGIKGTTGTQASFLELFNGDHAKVRRLDERVSELMGFTRRVPVCGQTYTRKLDYEVLTALAGVAMSAYKFAGDLRLLMNLKEVDEPFESQQVGSSAMAYKRNPMRSERICSLSRFVIELSGNGAHTHAQQWLERTLDDSANRRLSLPQAFLAADVILTLVTNVVSGLQVWPLVIRKHVMAELPFMATENILMAAVKAGGDRQTLHEAIREHSVAAGERVKREGAENDLLDRLAADPRFAAVKDRLPALVDPVLFIGRAPEQVDEFVRDDVVPWLTAHPPHHAATDKVNV